MMLISSLALVGWGSAAAEEVNYNGGTLTQEWKSENILATPTQGRFGYGIDNKFIIYNNYNKQIQVYNKNGFTGVAYDTNNTRNFVPCMGRDDAGNWIIRQRTQQQSINNTNAEFRIISADGTQQIDITLPSSIVTNKTGNSFLYMGAISGNLLTEEGAKIMFTGPQEDGIYVMQIRNGELIESESFKATMNTASLPETMPIKYSSESYVNAWKAADGTIHYLYVTRSDNPIDMVLEGQTLNCTAIDTENNIADAPVHRGQSNGFWTFSMGGKNYMALPCLPNFLDGFMVVQINDDGTMTMKGYHKNDFPRTETQYPNENSISSNWLNTEPIDDHSCYIYQYFPIGYMARYIFKDETDETTLADIVNDGQEGESYTIADDILGVYIAQMAPTQVYAKDLGKHRKPSVKGEGEIDYVRETAKLQGSDWDQSNWVLLEFANANEAQKFAGRWNSDFEESAAKVIKGGTLTGTLTNKLNPTMQVTSYTVPTEADEYSVNNYVTCNFMTPNVQTSTAEAHYGKKYFFIEPKAQEFVKVFWATYDGADHFSLPKANGTVNAADLKGGFTVNWELYPRDYKTDFIATKIYNFHAIVRYVEAASQGPRRTEGNVVEGNYVVYPLEGGDNLITAIDGVSVDREVVSVTYVNLMGMQSAEPFVGINLVVTRYNDGTVKTCKLVK